MENGVVNSLLVYLLWGGLIYLVIRFVARRKGHSHYSVQARAIEASEFHAKPIMNYSEYRLFGQLQQALKQIGSGYKVFPQVSMGELIASDTDEGHLAINCKRVDFAITNGRGVPVVLVEYQGEGHYQGNAHERDAIKREAAVKAGIAFYEVPSNYDVAAIEPDLRELILRP